MLAFLNWYSFFSRVRAGSADLLAAAHLESIGDRNNMLKYIKTALFV